MSYNMSHSHRNPSARKRIRDTSTLRNCEADLLASYGLSAHANSILPSLTLLATTWSASTAAQNQASYANPSYAVPFDPDQEHAFLSRAFSPGFSRAPEITDPCGPV